MSLNYFNPFFTVKIMDGLFICNQTATKDQQFLMNNKFGLIVNTCPLQFKVLPILNIYKVLNFHWQNSRGNMIDSIDMKLFKPIFEQMGKNLEQGHGILIVSDRGHSRSITFVLLYLMYRFEWDLFKALQYINSKRQNLEVRAAYLKLLLSYEKSGKSQSLDNSTQSNNEFPVQIKQSQSSKLQKWSSSKISSPQQQLISNTFKNTLTKHKINELNQQCRQMIAKQIKQQKRPSTNNNNTRNMSRDSIRKSSNNNNTKKSVQFSNQIQIIIKQSPVTHIFPQYQQLSSEFNIMQYQKDTRIPTQSTKQQHSQTIHNINANNNNIRKAPQTRHCQLSPSRPTSKKDVTSSISNTRMINVRKMDNSNNNNNHNYLHTQKNISQNQLIILSNSVDLYQNEFYQSDIKKQQNKMTNTDNNYQNQPLLRQKKQQNSAKQQIFRINNKPKQQALTSKNQTSFQLKSHQLLNYQGRPSSLKKFKAVFIEQKQRKISSPKKKQRKGERILTQPKYDYEFDNPALEQEKSLKDESRRGLSASHTQDQGFLFNDKIYQHKKSASTTMAMKMMNRFQKKSSNPFKQQKRCPTPQMLTAQIHKQLRSSSHNNFFTRPLSRGGSNSLKIATKKSVTTAVEQQSSKQQSKAPGPVFNVNINVNIGKLQMFGIKNTRDSRESANKVSLPKDKLTKAHSQIDKSQLLYNRIRSNSSNDNYSKFSISSLSISEKNDSTKDGLESHLLNKKNNQKLAHKNTMKINDQRQSNSGNQAEQFLHQPKGNQDDNIFASESFSKKQIMDKISRKLIKNSRNSKREQHTKQTSILENNFI